MLHLFPKKQYLTEVECPGVKYHICRHGGGMYYFVAKIQEAQTNETPVFHGKTQRCNIFKASNGVCGIKICLY